MYLVQVQQLQFTGFLLEYKWLINRFQFTICLLVKLRQESRGFCQRTLSRRL